MYYKINDSHEGIIKSESIPLGVDVTCITCECECGCNEPAIGKDDGGNWVCEECEEPTLVDENGTCYCSKQFSGSVCPDCGKKINWGNIQAQQYQSNWIEGDCDCIGRVWIDTERGNWGNYSYTDNDENDENEQEDEID